MKLNRRHFLQTSVAAGLVSSIRHSARATTPGEPIFEKLDQAAGRPVLKKELFSAHWQSRCANGAAGFVLLWRHDPLHESGSHSRGHGRVVFAAHIRNRTGLRLHDAICLRCP